MEDVNSRLKEKNENQLEAPPFPFFRTMEAIGVLNKEKEEQVVLNKELKEQKENDLQDMSMQVRTKTDKTFIFVTRADRHF